MNFGEIFGKSWKEYWGNFSQFFKFMALFLGIPTLVLTSISIMYSFLNPEVWSVVSNPALAEQLNPLDLLSTLSPYIALSIAIGLISFFLTIYVGKGIISLGLKGDKYKYHSLVSAGKERYWRFAGFAIVSTIFILLLSLLLFIPGIIFGIFWIFGAYIFVSQNKGIIGSLKASFHMVRGRWWQTFGYLILIVLVCAAAAIIVSIIDIPLAFTSSFYSALNGGEISKPFFVISALLRWLINFLANLFTIPFTIIFFKNYYLSVIGKSKKKRTN